MDNPHDTLPDTLEDWWADYARSLRRRGKSTKTTTLYRKSYLRFWQWAATDGLRPDPARIQRGDINAWTDQLRSTGLASATVAIYWRNLRPFWTWWAKETEARSPFNGADPPDITEEPIPVLHIDTVRSLLATCTGKTPVARRDTAIIRVLYDTGVRLGELAGLDIDDWDRGGDLLKVTGKTGTRAVPHSPTTGEALARWLRARGRLPHTEDPAMWIGKKGRLTDSGIEQMLARRCAQAGVGRISPQQFRHTWAHEFRDQGGSEGDLMHLAGWTSLAMAQRYGRSAAAARAQRAAHKLRLGDRL